MQTFDQRLFFSLYLLSSPGVPQQQFLQRLLAQPPHRLTQRGDNETKHTWAACYWLLNRQQEPDLNWFPLFLKINMRLMGNWLQWVSTAHAIFYCEQWVRAWTCGWRKMHLGTSRILHGDCWHIGRQIFLSGERHSVYDPAHFWLGLNLHLSLCNLSEGILKTLRFRQMSILSYKIIANIIEKLPMLFCPEDGQNDNLKIIPNIVSHWCLLWINLTIGFYFASFYIMKTKLCYFPNCFLRNNSRVLL